MVMLAMQSMIALIAMIACMKKWSANVRQHGFFNGKVFKVAKFQRFGSTFDFETLKLCHLYRRVLVLCRFSPSSAGHDQGSCERFQQTSSVVLRMAGSGKIFLRQPFSRNGIQICGRTAAPYPRLH
jgi:hypothetical protein